MKHRLILIVISLLLCVNVMGQQKKTVPMTTQPQKTEMQVLEETVLQLQAENQAMQKQWESMEKEVELYRGDVRAESSKMNTNMALWLAVLTIIMAILGVAIPLILNRRNERSMEIMLENVKKQADSADNQAKEAAKQAEQARQSVADIDVLRKHVDTIEKKINEDAAAAEKASIEAQANRLFAQAVSEKDSLKAIELYRKAIELKPDFSMAYNNLGCVLDEIGNRFDALENYKKAIELDPNDPAAYNNIACTLLDLDKIDEALNYVFIALSKDKSDSYVFDTRGQIYMTMCEYEKALNDFDHALSLNKYYYEAYKNRASCYRKMAETEEDPTKKAELIAKAEADEKKAESLKKE